MAYLRGFERSAAAGRSRGATAGALAWLVGTAVRRAEFDAALDAVGSPVLVVHARDDHYVPVDFALAAATHRPAWEVRILDRAGHHAHVACPADWMRGVGPWLGQLDEVVGE